MVVFTFQNIAYLPITINASSTFSDHFKKLGWQETQLDLLDDSYEIFGHFRDPIERHFKGTAQFLMKHRISHLVDDPVWQKVWATAVMDLHSYPITWAVGNRKIDWLLIKDGIDVTESTRLWVEQRNVELGTVQWKNKSDTFGRSLYEKLRTMELENKEHTLVYFYDSDIVLWNKLCGYH